MYVKSAIDFNNSGEFEASEIVLDELSIYGNSLGSFVIPPDVVMDTPLLMRVIADTIPIDFCNDLAKGETEDYSVIISLPNAPPEAEFFIMHIGEENCEKIYQFWDASDNIPETWSWDFGDGMTSTEENPIHTYASIGNYQTVLTVTNDFGTDSEEKFLEVEPSGFISLDILNTPVVNQPVYFEIVKQDISIMLWDFGDGSAVVASSAPSHTYNQTGTYTVTVTTESNDVCSNEISITFTVSTTDAVADLGKTDSSILIHPNPNSGEFSITIPEKETFSEVEVFNAVGKNVPVQTEHLGNQKLRLVLTDPAPGIYFIRLSMQTKNTYREKILVVN